MCTVVSLCNKMFQFVHDAVGTGEADFLCSDFWLSSVWCFCSWKRNHFINIHYICNYKTALSNWTKYFAYTMCKFFKEWNTTFLMSFHSGFFSIDTFSCLILVMLVYFIFLKTVHRRIGWKTTQRIGYISVQVFLVDVIVYRGKKSLNQTLL